MKCSILDIRQGSEYALISECTRIINIPGFWICHGYTRFWIKYLMIGVWHYDEQALDSEYVRVLNMLELHMVLNKIPRNRYWQGSEYVSSSEYASATKGSVENDPLYMFGRVLRIRRVINMLGLEYTRVEYKDSRYFECLEFWIC